MGWANISPSPTVCVMLRNRSWIVLLFLAVSLVARGDAWGKGGSGGAKNSVSKKIESFSLDDFRGKSWRLEDWADRQIVAVVFLGTECPLARLYAPRLIELQEKYGEQGVQLVAIDSNQQDSLAELAHFARTQEIEFPFLKDPGNRVADQFGASRTPEVFVLDRERRVRYQGRIDDQYTYGVQRPKVEHEYLNEAIEALLAGKEFATSHAEAVGCLIGRVTAPQENSEITYSRQISRIFQARCVECHRPGEIAPFALTEYEEVAGWAPMIEEVVREERMPPWHASPEFGHFANDARLSDEEKDLIYRWVAAGAPEGDPSDLPPPREFAEGWRIGKPDLVIPMRDTPFQVPAEGEVRYQYFVVDPGFTEDKWVKAAECRPGNRAVVHHIIVAAQGAGSRGRGELGSEWLTATAPGAMPLLLPDGLAKRIPAGSKLAFQLHYTPNGTAQDDLSSVGLIFADPKTVNKEVVTRQASNHAFRIPPGADNHAVEASFTFNDDSLMLAMFPHMHLRGKSFRYTAHYPDGRSEVLLDVPRYDFNWQNAYVFPEAKSMPAGTKLACLAHFDNSEANLANPDPTKEVRWGDQTWEEMMIGYFDMVLADQDLTQQAPQKRRTDEFLESARAGETLIDDELRTLAAGALESEEAFQRFAVKLQTVAPQLDRACLSVVREDQLVIERAAQEKVFRRLVGAKGVSVRSAGMALTDYAKGSETVVNQDLSKAPGPDLRFMRLAFSASLHVPLQFDGQPAALNFWSSEKDAFPEEAVKLLTEIARLAATGSSPQ
jgi:peroxiredoxin